ncbi:MAG: GntR family transcriptional regulator [Paludisphaera borealis]|uniref:GntR family transcriptional regulator n=1 Tax=Paludisphaera borealis TaxID=1387353 RepID=UPI00283F72AC|nr:GntR family transcriptional regulator [Paludisphaera borealis]MDR3620760.1 GntR family transcriptional regulator [Paludisphaera borealis]
MILIDLSESDGRPIYGRISDRIKFAIAGDVLRPGEMAPSVRELSKQLVVNPNTVARSYRDLQAEGLLEPVRGTGLQVAEGAPEKCRSARSVYVRTRLRGAIDEARGTGLDPVEIETILHEEWAKARDAASQPNGRGA